MKSELLPSPDAIETPLVNALWFKSLSDYASYIGAEVYPNLLLQSAYTKKGLSGDRVAWNIVNNRGQLYTFDPVTLKVDDEADYKLYMINPNYLSSYLESIKNSFNKKFGITTIGQAAAVCIGIGNRVRKH